MTNTRPRSAKAARRGVALLSLSSLLSTVAGCGVQSNEEPVEQAAESVQALSAGQSAAAAAAADAKAAREQAGAEYSRIKEQLSATSASDKAGIAALTRRLDSLQAKALEVPGAGGPLPEARGTPSPVIERRKYENLRAKMSAYDMSNPRDVAAWAELKRKELGQ